MTAPSTTRTPGSEHAPTAERTALSPEVSHFLVQLSIALHKTATYPAEHPALESAVQALTLRLDQLLSSRKSVTIGVARERLLIEGGATDASNAVLRSLAEALHRHQIGTIRLKHGVSPAEVSTLLNALAEDTRRVTPVAMRDAQTLEQWPHIELTPVALDQLELAGGGGGDALEGLWLSLAAATLKADPDGELTPEDLARALRQNVRDQTYDRVIADYMSRVGQELALRGGGRSSVAGQLGDMIERAGDQALRQLIELGVDLTKRRQFLRVMSGVLPAQSVIALTRAAADVSKQAISHPLLRLFGKMAANSEQADGPISAAADSALRDAINQLVDGWTLDSPNPEAYRDLLRELSASQRQSLEEEEGQPGAEAFRLIGISLETNAVGPAVWRALNELVGRGGLDDILDSLRAAGQSEAARQIRAHLARPEQILVLLESRQSRNAVEQLLSWTGIEAADALLDGLEAADSRSTRRQIIARLVGMREEIGQKIIDRLEHGPWYVQRNMLYLLSEMERVPAELKPAVWLEHEDPRVRREAVRVALLVPESRARAIEIGLREDDSRILHLALNSALDECPPGLGPPLISLLDDPRANPSIRLSAVRLIGRTRTPDVRAWLIARVLTKGSWWRRPTLAPKSPETLIAISALRNWSAHRHAAYALTLARQSNDAETRFAATDSTDDWP